MNCLVVTGVQSMTETPRGKGFAHDPSCPVMPCLNLSLKILKRNTGTPKRTGLEENGWHSLKANLPGRVSHEGLDTIQPSKPHQSSFFFWIKNCISNQFKSYISNYIFQYISISISRQCTPIHVEGPQNSAGKTLRRQLLSHPAEKRELVSSYMAGLFDSTTYSNHFKSSNFGGSIINLQPGRTSKTARSDGSKELISGMFWVFLKQFNQPTWEIGGSGSELKPRNQWQHVMVMFDKVNSADALHHFVNRLGCPWSYFDVPNVAHFSFRPTQ